MHEHKLCTLSRRECQPSVSVACDLLLAYTGFLTQIFRSITEQSYQHWAEFSEFCCSSSGEFMLGAVRITKVSLCHGWENTSGVSDRTVADAAGPCIVQCGLCLMESVIHTCSIMYFITIPCRIWIPATTKNFPAPERKQGTLTPYSLKIFEPLPSPVRTPSSLPMESHLTQRLTS